MKRVSCEYCGARFVLEDYESVNSYECSFCAGNLLEKGESNQINDKHLKTEKNHSNDHVIYCKDCNLKHNIIENEEIEDYKCSSCGGDLSYFNTDLKENSPVNNYSHENGSDLDNLRESNNTKPTFKNSSDETIKFTETSSANFFNSSVINQEEKNREIRKDLKDKFSNGFEKNKIVESLEAEEKSDTPTKKATDSVPISKKEYIYNFTVLISIIIICIWILYVSGFFIYK
ncbi:MAG: hypothetical protein LBV42_01075 [Methanobrevibacter sp.]|jgi:Zn-finger nucleic acid-binding protein|nr:hypothetical protein [Methanobrevibacter sp.]